MRKIFIERSESAAEAVERILAEPDSDIILVVPRNAKIAEALANFHLLNREADGVGKRLTIESVDEEVLALAKAAKIPAAHPLFSSIGSRSISDIVPAADSRSKAEKKSSPGGKKTPEKIKKSSKAAPKREEEKVIEKLAAAGGEPDADALAETAYLPEKPKRGKFKRRALALAAGAAVLLALSAWAWGAFFGRAEISINFAEVSWEGTNQILATKTVAAPSAQGGVIPAEIFRDRRNVTQIFQATGKAQVSEKAKGRLTIYNAYSSQPQTLVATTRFETPDGKIFRLDNQVVIPGAEIKDGKIVPKSIEAGVTADKAGADYNLGRVEKLTIPGFKGTPRFQGFYGALLNGASGGFIGEKTVPTEADIAAAKSKTAAVLKSSLENGLLSGRPAEFKILPGASETVITKMTAQAAADEKGNFGVIGEAEFRAIGFRESDLKAALLDIARREAPDTEFRTWEAEYSDVRPDYDKGEVRFSVKSKGELVPVFSPDDFRAEAAGADLNSVRSRILKLPRLADAKISVRPMWLRRLPADPGRITLTLE
jgi:hypothetical protein